MSLHVATDGLHVYDDEHDVWHRFETRDEMQSFLHSYSEPDITGESYERVRTEIADNYQTQQLVIDGTAANVVPIQVAPHDPQRRLVRVSCFTAAAAGNGIQVGHFHELSGAGANGFLIPSGSSQDFPVTAPVWVKPTNALVTVSILIVRD